MQCTVEEENSIFFQQHYANFSEIRDIYALRIFVQGLLQILIFYLFLALFSSFYVTFTIDICGAPSAIGLSLLYFMVSGVDVVLYLLCVCQKLYDKTLKSDQFTRARSLNGIKRAQGELAKTQAEYDVFRKYKAAISFSTWNSSKDNFSASHLCKLFSSIVGLAINVMNGTELSSHLFFVLSSCDGNGLKTHFSCKLNSQMAKSTNPKDSYQISQICAALQKSIRRCYTSTRIGTITSAYLIRNGSLPNTRQYFIFCLKYASLQMIYLLSVQTLKHLNCEHTLKNIDQIIFRHHQNYAQASQK